MSEVYVGTEIGNQNIRVEASFLDPAEPTHKFVTITKTWGNKTKSSIDPLTQTEARYLRDVLVELFPL